MTTVHEAWSLVMGDVQGLRKGDLNRVQGFAFRGVDATMNAVGPALRRHGVSVVPASVSVVEIERYQTAKGGQMQGVTVAVEYAVHGPGGDSFPGAALGAAADSGDKAIPKAMSVAFRTFLLQSLCIPTDEPDPDAESHERAAPPVLSAMDVIAQRFKRDRAAAEAAAEKAGFDLADAEQAEAFADLIKRGVA